MTNLFNPMHEQHIGFADVWGQLSRWGEDRNILSQATAKDQFLKMLTEYSELIEADTHALRLDAACDIVVVAIMIANITGLRLSDFEEVSHVSITNHISDSPYVISMANLAGKLADSILKKDKSRVRNNLYKIILCACCIYDLNNITAHGGFVDGMHLVAEELDTRHGTFYNGAFVKDTDPAYEKILDDIRLEVANNFLSKG